MDLRATYRDAGSVTVVDIGGRITLGEGSALLRKTIRELLDDLLQLTKLFTVFDVYSDENTAIASFR
jgi:hypothetical protein